MNVPNRTLAMAMPPVPILLVHFHALATQVSAVMDSLATMSMNARSRVTTAMSMQRVPIRHPVSDVLATLVSPAMVSPAPMLTSAAPVPTTATSMHAATTVTAGSIALVLQVLSAMV